jgi:hypothetical protein
LFDTVIEGGAASIVICHGQKYNAVIVIVVSRQFENVLVEQNHSQGLKSIIKS